MNRYQYYAGQKKLKIILLAIRMIQSKSPLEPVNRKQVANKIKSSIILEMNVYPQLMKRAFNKLCMQGKLIEDPKKTRRILVT